MATLKTVAHDVLEEARDGIAWIALYKLGRSWHAECFWPEMESEGVLSFDLEEVKVLRDILAIDPDAILVNGWYSNLGPPDAEMTVTTLSDALRWQYACGYNLLVDAI